MGEIGLPPKRRENDRSVTNLAEALVRMRWRSRRTQAEVAAEMGTTQQTLQNYARANGFCLEIGFIAAEDSDETAKTGCVLVIEGQPG